MLRPGIFFCLLFLFALNVSAQPLMKNPVSTEAQFGFSPCLDTFSFVNLRRYYDLGVMLPSWHPVVSDEYIAELEGVVLHKKEDGSDGPHVSHEDLPFYHYSHDFDFNVIPDTTPDRRFLNLLPLLVYEHGVKPDTVMRHNIHCEWESGIGASNKKNPLTPFNETGKSGGFFSAGHEAGDILWNWPSTEDWVHVEGKLVWDRGHPPAKTEIHPVQLIAIQRNLPQVFVLKDQLFKYSTRIDVFGSGDGSALWNNRAQAPSFVKPVVMSAKDYRFQVKCTLSRPSPQAPLKYMRIIQKGDCFPINEIVELNQETGTAWITIPWKSGKVADTAIYARSFYLYWDDKNGAADTQEIPVYKVKLKALHFKKLSEKDSKAELRMYADVGGNWLFLNDFFGKKGNILKKGMGKTRKKHWTLNQEFLVACPMNKRYRIMTYGWEQDGVDLLMGDLIDPHSPCNQKTKRHLKSRIFSFSNMLVKGCMDDQFGGAGKLHTPLQKGEKILVTAAPDEGKHEDPCPFAEYDLKDRYTFQYEIERIH